MRILFIRHGHPDYAHDCLTPLGRLHAQAAAERLSGEGVERIFSSPYGRAKETAGYLAQRIDLPVELCDFMHEIHWGAADDQPIFENGHPWSTADAMVARGRVCSALPGPGRNPSAATGWWTAWIILPGRATPGCRAWATPGRGCTTA